ncbi:MAG: hypothetical protein P1P87_13195 [Trueperaceae bacterium]|nr:hypothetical protein [Trueperaceae bacterium]
MPHPRRSPLPRPLALALAVAFAAVLTPAVAQAERPLEHLAPPSALVALGFAPDGGVPQGLADALDELDWASAGATLARLAALMGDRAGDLGGFADGAPFAEGAGGDPMAALRAELATTCALAADALEGVVPGDLARDGLLTVSVSPFAPVPQALALARPGDPTRAAALQDALIGCYGGPELEQDGVSLYVLGDGGDLPLVVARVDDVFLAGTDPNLVRTAIRLARGADEPSLADGPLGAAWASLAPGGLDLAVDASALADVLAGLIEPVEAETDVALARVLAALRTIGAGAARVGWDTDGLRLEQVLVVPSDAPDAALAQLLTAAPPAGRPIWLPAGSVAVTSTHVPVRDVVAYVDGWLADLGPTLGVAADLRGLASDALDVDLDAALLDWVGETVHTIQLEAVGTDLRGLVVGPATVALIPVADEAAARAGLELLGPALLRGFASAAATGSSSSPDPFADPFAGNGPLDAGLDALFGSGAVAVDALTIDGVAVDRIRMGPTFDLGVTVVDGHLVLATPARALEALLAARGGAEDLLADAAWRDAYAAVPVDVRDVSLSDVPATLHGLADLADLAAQPLASALHAALYLTPVGSEVGPGFGSGFETEGGLTDPTWDAYALEGTDLGVIGALDVGATTPGELTDAAPLVAWDLVGAVPGSVVTVEMNDRSDGAIDTYLFVVDADTGLVLFDNDDFGRYDRSLVSFLVEPGVRYRVVATSWSRSDVGRFVVSVEGPSAETAAPEPEPAEEAEAVEPVTFAELLQVTELGPQALRVLAQRSGLATSVTTVENGVVHTRTTIPLR